MTARKLEHKPRTNVERQMAADIAAAVVDEFGDKASARILFAAWSHVKDYELQHMLEELGEWLQVRA